MPSGDRPATQTGVPQIEVTPEMVSRVEELFDEWCGDADYVSALPDSLSLFAKWWPIFEKASKS
jgi:hypothetical protein